MIEFRDVCKYYQIGEHKITALEHANLKIASGELVSIMGASGSGKTSCMNILGLLDRPSSGQYFLVDTEVSTLSNDKLAHLRNYYIGFVFQQFFLLPRLTALQNVGLPLIYRGTPPAEIKERSLASLDRVGMSQYVDHRPNQLSGGQQQRVAIARALVTDPTVILADEPTGALDSKTGQIVMDLLLHINQQENATIIIVTHDQKVALQCQRIIRLSDGRVIEGGEESP